MNQVMPLFERKFVPLQRLDIASLLPPPHLEWEADYGANTALRLATETGELLSGYLSRRDDAILAAAELQSYLRRYFRVRDQTLNTMKSDPSRAEQYGVFVEMMYEAFERVAERRPDQNPFRDFDSEDLTRHPAYLHGKEEAFAWPFLIGRLVGEAEIGLGWKRPSGKVDRRTWAALGGMGFLLARELAPLPRRSSGASEWPPKVQTKGMLDERTKANLSALMELANYQRMVVDGYADGR